MAINFKKFAADGDQFMKLLAKELGYPNDIDRAGRVLRSILYAFRNQLTIEESVQMLAQFPMFLKAIYVQNWSLRKKQPKSKHLEDFYQEIKMLDQPSLDHDFHSDEEIDQAISVVFIVLRKYISLGELEDIKSCLPKDLKPLLNSVTMI